MGTYTTTALVQKEIEKIDSTLLPADIEAYIGKAEGVLLGILKDNVPASFDAAKHSLLREFATLWAALAAATYDTTNFTSTVDAELTINALIFKLKIVMDLLKDERVLQSLKNL